MNTKKIGNNHPKKINTNNKSQRIGKLKHKEHQHEKLNKILKPKNKQTKLKTLGS